MEHQGFALFSNLPPELRIQIWESCLQSFEPNAQFFTIINCNESIEPAALSKHLMVSGPCEGIAVAAPRSRSTGRRSWTEGNMSAYLADHGLWTACWESRLVMLKHYKASRPDGNGTTRQSSGVENKIIPTPLTESFVSNTERQYFSFNPTNDLICLQTLNFETIFWAAVSVDISFFDCFRGLEPMHIGLELEPHWRDGSDMWTYHAITFERIARRAAWGRKLWLIDYTLRRVPGAAGLDRERLVFKGLGCKFVEVKASDDGWDEIDNTTSELSSNLPGPKLSAIKLLHQLVLFSASFGPVTTFGILACEWD